MSNGNTVVSNPGMTIRDVAYKAASRATNLEMFLEYYDTAFRAIMESEKKTVEEVLGQQYEGL